MPELPEIFSRAKELQFELVGRSITDVEVLQPNSLNIEKEEFIASLRRAVIQDIAPKGKWILFKTTQGWLLLNLGMGGEILLVTRQTLPEKYRLIFDFDDGRSLAVNFWWFGYAHFAANNELDKHKMTAKLGPNALDVSETELKFMLAGRKSRIKSFLLDQSKIAGIGNAYIHDILWFAGLHPNRTIDTMTDEDIFSLAISIHDGLQPSLDKGGAFYELNIYGEEGGFTMEDIKIGYKEGQPCPKCSAEIVKIKTGSTQSFICPTCQEL